LQPFAQPTLIVPVGEFVEISLQVIPLPVGVDWAVAAYGKKINR
jgi:hypothetical protein